MKVSYSWLQKYFDKKLPTPDKASELFNTHAFEVEGMEKVGDDTVLDIKVLPDRACYALSHRGIARELGAMLGISLDRKVRADAPFSGEVDEVKVISDTDLCRRYMARRIDNVTVSQSPKEIKDHLEAIGARSINSIVDATNFVMFDVGQPLHAFDADLVKGSIKVRNAHAGEKITILDGREMELRENDLVIADDLGALAIAGVKGGKRAEVTVKTKNIIIESANFDPVSVRKTSTRLNLRNDSSKRFENDITPALAHEAMERVTKLINDLASDSKAGSITDIYPKPASEWTIECDTPSLRAMVGANIANQKIEDILKSLDFRVALDKDNISVVPPLERLDVRIIEDVADELARMYGYDNLESKSTPAIPPTPIDKTFYYAEKIKNILVGAGFSEVMNYSLVAKGSFEISYPLAGDKSALRESLAPKLNESLVLSARNADLLGIAKDIKIFEIGKVFPKSGERLSLAIGVKKIKGKDDSAMIIADVVKLNIEKILGVTIAGESNTKLGTWETDLDALVTKLPDPVAVGDSAIKDLNFVPLPLEIKYKPFSVYPFITRDIALFVPSGTDQVLVAKVIGDSLAKSAGNLLVKGPELFDKFEKEGKISFGFRMIFQSFERTLSDDEINVSMTTLYETLKAKGWEVR